MPAKIIITRKSDDVITNIVDNATTVENGLKVIDSTGEYIIGFIKECNQYNNVETADTILPQKYKYTATGGFVLNTDYVPYVSTEQQIASLQADNANINYALMMGGLI